MGGVTVSQVQPKTVTVTGNQEKCCKNSFFIHILLFFYVNLVKSLEVKNSKSSIS